MENGGRSSFSSEYTQEDPFGGYPGGMEQRLYSKLMNSGRYSDLDKAKHNTQYRSYLLENYDDEMPF